VFEQVLRRVPVKVSNAPRELSVRRRQIGDADLHGVAELLSRGFRLRSKGYWLRGLERLRSRSVPKGFPRFGSCLESNGRLVGVVLMIYSEVEADAAPVIRCNLSSWYVEPAFRGYAPLLLSYALRDKRVTYLNLSAAPNTWPTVEAQGFRRFDEGAILSIPVMNPCLEKVRIEAVESVEEERAADLAERDLLLAHAANGCVSLVVEAQDGLHPFVFVRRRILRRLLPTMQLIYCRDPAEFVRFAGPLGRRLLTRGMPWVLVHGASRFGGLVGRQVGRGERHYVRGPHTPRLGDLAYTEGVFFGP
jgi:hypothetical protein